MKHESDHPARRRVAEEVRGPEGGLPPVSARNANKIETSSGEPDPIAENVAQATVKRRIDRRLVSLMAGVLLLVVMVVVMADYRRATNAIEVARWYARLLDAQSKRSGLDLVDPEEVFSDSPSPWSPGTGNVSKAAFARLRGLQEGFIVGHTVRIDRRVLPDGYAVVRFIPPDGFAVEWLSVAPYEEATRKQSIAAQRLEADEDD